MSIFDNASLANLEGLNNLSSIGDLRINDNDALTNLHSARDIISIYSNINLENLCGIHNIIGNGFSGIYNFYGNTYNPPQEDILKGNCNQ